MSTRESRHLLERRDGYLLDPNVDFALALAPPPLPPTPGDTGSALPRAGASG